ncbi:hypothetical protein F5Y13DRAFT_179536 [Hypoxylon sp. FL1857]|nr:hypothetical protein F5Y13DRAFT_179536 [Hypoxylon sp. FL1857]
MGDRNAAIPNGVYRRPLYDPSRVPLHFGGGVAPTRPYHVPQSPSLQSDLSSVVTDTPSTLVGSTPRYPIGLGTDSPQSQQPDTNPHARNQAMEQRPVDFGFPNPFVRPIIRPPPGIPFRPIPNDGGYVPMGRWPTTYARNFLPPSIWQRQLELTGISRNYGGNIFLPSNQSADIPEELSTSLWLTNLPPDCTHQLLLDSIRDCGKIYAAVINPPVNNPGQYGQGGAHITSASKLVFFDRIGVERLLAKSRAGEFIVGDFVPRLRPNRIRSAARTPGPQCRVLHIEGPSAIVNEDYLNAFFQSKFTYELERVLTIANCDNKTRQEWRFGSFRCQAESARQAISREKERRNMSELDSLLWSKVTVHYGVDPCA